MKTHSNIQMNGTEKQIKWAEEIKATLVPDLLKKCKPEMVAGITEIIDSKDASWWISRRETMTKWVELAEVLKPEIIAKYS